MIVTNYTPPPTVARFMQSDAPVRLIMGPVGSGKSTGDIMEIARRACGQAKGRDGIRRTRWVIVRNTKQQLTDTTLKTWLEWFPDGVAGRWREVDRTFVMRFGDVHAEVLFRALDDPEDVKRLLSLELTGGFVNEARETPLEIVIALRSRCGRYPSKKEGGPTWFGLVMDTNPPSTDHWIYQKFIVEKPRGWEFFHQPGGLEPTAENTENLPANYYQDMMEGADEDWVNVHVHARFGRSKAGRPVFEATWVSKFHRRASLNVLTNTPVIIGMDFGRTPAAQFLQRDAKGRVLLQGEVVSQNMGLETFLTREVKPYLTRRFAGIPVAVGGDPAGWQKSQINEQSCRDILVANKFVVVRPASNLIAPRLKSVEDLLKQQIDGEALFLVNETECPVTVAGFEHGYRYKRRRDGSHEEVPEKNEYSHPHDGLQYGCMVLDSAVSLAGKMHLGSPPKIRTVSLTGWT